MRITLPRSAGCSADDHCDARRCAQRNRSFPVGWGTIGESGSSPFHTSLIALTTRSTASSGNCVFWHAIDRRAASKSVRVKGTRMVNKLACGITSGLHSTAGDRYAAGFVLEAFRAHGITYAPSAQDRSALFLELLPLVNAGRVRLLDHPELLRELRGLERRRGTAGRDRIDHMPGQHDDRANCVAGALVLAAGRDPAAAAAVARMCLSIGESEPRAAWLESGLARDSDGCPRP